MTPTSAAPRRWGAAALTAAALVLAGCSTAAPPPAAPTAQGAGGGGPTGASRPSTVPPDLLLPDEGGVAESAETTEWTTETGTDRTWLLDPCSPTAYPTDRDRTSFRTVSRTGPELLQARQLGQYPSEDVAAEVVAGFRRALEACRTGTSAAGSRWQWVARDAPALGPDGFLAAGTEGGAGLAPAGERIAVTRVGAAVFLAYDSGEYSSAEIDGGAKQVQLVAVRFLESL